MILGLLLAGAVAFACSSGNGSIGSATGALTGGTPCGGVVLDASRQYSPKSWTDAHVAFAEGTLTFAIPAQISVTHGNSDNGKVKFTYSVSGGVPVTCLYRGDFGVAYNFVKCKQAPVVRPDPDDDDLGHDDGPSDPAPVAGSTVTADTFTLHVNRGKKAAGTTSVSMSLGGPVVDDHNACTTDACNPVDGVTHTLINVDDGNHCTIDACDPATGVSHTEVTTFEETQAGVANQQVFANALGAHATYSTTSGPLDTNNPFFKSLGTNGRACVHCHKPEDGFGLSAASVRARFEASCGLDPIFRTNDGSNTPTADVSTLDAKRLAYSRLLERGLIRIQLRIPEVREYDLIAVDDPTGNVPDVASALANGISVFRRPLPATNLKFASQIMFDGREPNLSQQAINATVGHAQGAVPSAADVAAIVAFETSLFTSQVQGSAVGSTSEEGATGDPFSLSTQPFFIDMNRPPPPRGEPANAVVDKNVFTLYSAWAASESAHRQAVQRGQVVFNTAPLRNPDLIPICGVPCGINTCSNCHNAFNSGGGTFSFELTATPSGGGFQAVRTSAAAFRIPGMPLYTFKNKATGAIRESTDPGIGLIDGRFRTINFMKTPALRGLAGRAPYFHNGMSATLADVVDHYNVVFEANFTDQQKSDLVAFLSTL
jgi:hypothetical protein